MDAAQLVLTMRSASGISRTELARRAGVPTSTVSRIESGRTDATIGMLHRLADAAGAELIVDLELPPSLADHFAIADDIEGDWTPIRACVAWALLHPGRASDVIRRPPPETAGPAARACLAAIAETIADELDVALPAWTSKIPPLPSELIPRGTPRMIERWQSETPPRFVARNVVMPRSAVWHAA